jgi:sensor histidine kinase YesM
MNFSYFNFWIRNVVLYLFFCLLGLITLLIDNKQLLHETDQLMPLIFNGAMMFLIAHVQVYVHNVFLYKHYFSKQNFKYLAGTILLFTSYFLINYFTPFKFVRDGDIVTMCISIFLVYLVGLGFYYMHKNILERNLLFRTELIDRDEEIRHLKAQLNPHFLFNALNNLYGSALTDPSETPEKILELSELLRYQIESSKKEFVSLEDELEFIRKYLNYEQNRNPKLVIDFRTDVAYSQVHLSPMLFMPFIENAIKYSSHADKPFCGLSVQADKKRLIFRMQNNFDHNHKKFSGTNTGISNTKQRLDLTYRDKHELLIDDKGELYTIELTIRL